MAAPKTDLADHSTAAAFPITLSVDAMGGHQGPAAVVSVCANSAKKNPQLGFILHGPADELAKLKEPLADLTPEYFEFFSGLGKP